MSYRIDLVADEDCAISIANIEDNSTPVAQAAKTVVTPPSLLAKFFNGVAESLLWLLLGLVLVAGIVLIIRRLLVRSRR